MREMAEWRECIWAKRDRRSGTQREIQPSLNLGQAAVCSKNGETPYCKGNTIMRFAVGRKGPDRATVNAQQKARKKRRDISMRLCPAQRRQHWARWGQKGEDELQGLSWVRLFSPRNYT